MERTKAMPWTTKMMRDSRCVQWMVVRSEWRKREALAQLFGASPARCWRCLLMPARLDGSDKSRRYCGRACRDVKEWTREDGGWLLGRSVRAYYSVTLAGGWVERRRSKKSAGGVCIQRKSNSGKNCAHSNEIGSLILVTLLWQRRSGK